MHALAKHCASHSDSLPYHNEGLNNNNNFCILRCHSVYLFIMLSLAVMLLQPVFKLDKDDAALTKFGTNDVKGFSLL